jgi:hypothetical protein
VRTLEGNSPDWDRAREGVRERRLVFQGLGPLDRCFRYRRQEEGQEGLLAAVGATRGAPRTEERTYPRTCCDPVGSPREVDLNCLRQGPDRPRSEHHRRPATQRRGSPRRGNLRGLLASSRLGTSANPTTVTVAISLPDRVHYVAAVRRQRDLILKAAAPMTL